MTHRVAERDEGKGRKKCCQVFFGEGAELTLSETSQNEVLCRTFLLKREFEHQWQDDHHTKKSRAKGRIGAYYAGSFIAIKDLAACSARCLSKQTLKKTSMQEEDA